MNIFQSLISGGAASTIEAADSLIDNAFTSDDERLSRAEALERIQATRDTANIALNALGVKSSTFFIAGWRPAIGWVGVFVLIYQFIVFPVLDVFFDMPKPMDADMLWNMVVGMLGVAGFRTVEKLKGKAR